MKIVIATNAMKGSLNANQVADAIEKGLLKTPQSLEIIKFPIADGGDGMSLVLKNILNTKIIPSKTINAIGNHIQSHFLYSADKKLAVIEMANSCGLAQLQPQEYDPMNANTMGVGQMIKHALDIGATSIILGIGGSATNDMGTGTAQALGFQFFDKNSRMIKAGAAQLHKIASIDTSNVDRRLKITKFQIACDVTNPLLGLNGAANVYAPQKGASAKQIKLIENGFEHFVALLEKHVKKDIRHIKGAGAAGGMGAGLVALLNTPLLSGADLILDILEFDKLSEHADLIITSEGRLDTQTQFGKAPYAISKRAQKTNTPCYVIAGQIDGHHQVFNEMGFTKLFSLCASNMRPEYAMQHAASLIEKICETHFFEIKQ